MNTLIETWERHYHENLDAAAVKNQAYRLHQYSEFWEIWELSRNEDKNVLNRSKIITE